MKQLFPILVLVCLAWLQAWAEPRNGVPAQTSGQLANSDPAIPADQVNARKAKAILEQGIKALGGETYLTIHDREEEGRLYSFHHGRESGGGTVFWSFVEFPDKERIEITKERDIAELYVGSKAWEVTYKGARPFDEKDRVDY